MIISFSIYLGFAGYRQYDYNQGYSWALIRTIRSFDDEGLYKLLDKRKNMDSTPKKLAIFILDDWNRNPLQEAAAIGNYNAVVALFEAGANVNFINSITIRTPLINSLRSSEVNRFLIANYLVDHGADVNYSITKHGVSNALAESISYYGVSMVESYDFFLRMISLDSNPYIYVSPGNIFLKSAFDKHKLVMVYLLENDLFDTNVVNKASFSALMFLARFTIDQCYPSSKRCSCCGDIKTDLKLSERVYYCPNCELHLDRDHNAAININKEGFRKYKLAFQL